MHPFQISCIKYMSQYINGIPEGTGLCGYWDDNFKVQYGYPKKLFVNILCKLRKSIYYKYIQACN